MELQRRLKELFQLLFVLPGRLGGGDGVGVAGWEVVSKMKVRLQQELMDYRDYLSVKAQRNITMTSYPSFIFLFTCHLVFNNSRHVELFALLFLNNDI